MATPQRLDRYLVERHPRWSRHAIAQAIMAGACQVNGATVTKPSATVSSTDVVVLSKQELATKQPFDLPVVYEDEAIVVIDKPAGVLTHPVTAQSSEYTVADFMRPKTSFGRDGLRPGIIHRLDRETSGLLVCAKTLGAAAELQAQFAARTIAKVYTAIVTGIPAPQTATIDVPISQRPNKRGLYTPSPHGRPAQTNYSVIEHTAAQSLISLRPITGRTHQLRVHMKYIGHPIIGDRLYAASSPKAPRLMLHATSISFALAGNDHHYESVIPEGFALTERGSEVT